MKIGNLLNIDRVNALNIEPNAYIAKQPKHIAAERGTSKVNVANIPKVIFPEPYENARGYYNKSEFVPPPPPHVEHAPQQHQQSNSMFDIKSLLPMLMSGKLDMLKPLMSMFGGGKSSGLSDIAKIFDIFKPKEKTKNAEKEAEEISSKFDDMIIIED